MNLAHLSDLEIANQATLQPIGDIADKAGIPSDALEPYGHYKAKIDINKIRKNKQKREGRIGYSNESNTCWGREINSYSWISRCI
ncbi:formyltetrahydrofolate synthetase [Staphylococcus gallinarum]|uniref:Formyltetrahydrofolate synthetase n=1 Tax=Staphylococcus gallinarum TaxID=1293 RepID=A0A380FJT4_STAGA|nr:formyltetrahydrofolate synthetase [Staphylococcus gallinarum]